MSNELHTSTKLSQFMESRVEALLKFLVTKGIIPEYRALRLLNPILYARYTYVTY